jgi:hypothetical protein
VQGFWRDPNGVPHWLIAVRASFDLGPDGSLQLSAAQLAPLMAAEYFGEPGRSSLRYDADVGPLKPTSELLVHASAYAPSAEPVEQVRVALRVGTLDKQLLVFGERQYTQLGTTRPEPFLSCPIRYEAAYGGGGQQLIDARNPLGLGFVQDPESRIGQPAHRIEYASGDAAELGPAGFGPIAGHWQPRLAHAGTYDEAWHTHKRPLLPDDYDPRSTLAAPLDQRMPDYLRGGEWIELTNLTPTGLLRVRVPRIAIQCDTQIGTTHRTHPGKLCSVIIEPDAARFTLVWQSALPVAARDLDELEGTIIKASEVDA